MENEVSNVKESRLSICLFITAMCACVFSVALGLVVLVGWHSHNMTLIQVLPAFVPMQYNTALGFVLCGSGMSLAIFKKQYSAVIVGSLAIVIGGLTLLEYSMGMNLGIDELFMKHTIIVKTSHPGRMAPNTATCFVLIGSVLVFQTFFRKQIYKYQLEAIFASLAFGLGIVALSGYMIHLETAYGWGSLTRMAVHTSIGFVVLGVGAFALIWSNDLTNEKMLPRWLAIPTGIGTITVAICFWQALQSEYASIARQSNVLVLVGLSRFSFAILVSGVLLATAMAMAVYFAQISIRRTREIIKTNQILKEKITERKQAEEALQYEREYTEHIISTAPNLICGIAPDGTTVFVNEAVVKVTGYTREEVLGKNWWKVFYPGEEYKQVEHLLHGLANNKIIDYEMILTTKNKEKRAISWNSVKHYDKHSKLIQIIGIGTDISERKKAEETLQKAHDELEDNVAEQTKAIKKKADKLGKSEKALIYLLEDVNEIRDNLEKANIKLKELDKLKSMFIASMSHELRTPLNSIIGFTGIILQGMVGELNPKQKDHLGRVNKSAKHLLLLINDIIDLSKVEAGKVDVFVEDISLDEIINEAVDSIRLQANEKGLVLDVSVPPGIRMNTDSKRLYQCILNYLSNAVKFTETGTVSITAHVTNGEVEFIVSDTGIGISNEDQQRLFTPFTRIDSHLRAKTLGTGLGLYLTRKLTTDILKGSVEVQSQPGKGSTFRLRLPKMIGE